MIKATAAGVELDLRIIPRARKSEFASTREDALVVRVAAPPLEGAANDALIDFLSATLRLPRRAIRIISGETSRRKRVAIDGVTVDAVLAMIRSADG